jgi:flagellar biosynthetic protein FlhB
MEGKDGKTEQATGKRLSEERRKGNLPISMEIATVGALLAGLIGVWIAIPIVGPLLVDFTREVWRLPVGTVWTPETVRSWSFQGVLFLSAILIPFTLPAMIGGIIAFMGQTGPYFSTEPLAWKLSLLNPMNGFKQLFSVQSIFNMVLSLCKIALISLVIYLVVRSRVTDMFGLMWNSPAGIAAWLFSLLMRIAITSVVVFVIIAAIDAIYRHRKYARDIMMTKKEVEDEHKNQELPSTVRGAQRRKMRELTLNRMMAAVPTATIVVTNPTHVAVALQYDPDNMGAPRVVAKGVRLVAERIKRIAKENDVMIIERPPLARALYKHVKVGQEIPGTFYGAVAELLALIYKLGHASLPKHRDGAA